jgi:hypothetical protein
MVRGVGLFLPNFSSMSCWIRTLHTASSRGVGKNSEGVPGGIILGRMDFIFEMTAGLSYSDIRILALFDILDIERTCSVRRHATREFVNSYRSPKKLINSLPGNERPSFRGVKLAISGTPPKFKCAVLV